jgi:predicted CXXCH cytochrome family protein
MAIAGGIGLLVAIGCPIAFLQADEPAVVNPHWTPNGCTQCHAPGEPKMASNHRNITAECLACHDGVRASSEKHPANRPFDGPAIRKPEGWPAPDNMLGCLSCHDVLLACNKSRSRPPQNSAFLRGQITDDPVAFCANCHIDTSSHERHNPHDMIDQAGQVRKDACFYCHNKEVSMDRSGKRTRDAALVDDETSICLGCHTRHVDFFEPGHLGATMDKTMQKYVTDLPLTKKQTITCSTCHNPHGAGWFAPNSSLARGAQSDFDPSDAMKMRGYSNNICGACHEQ